MASSALDTAQQASATIAALKPVPHSNPKLAVSLAVAVSIAQLQPVASDASPRAVTSPAPDALPWTPAQAIVGQDHASYHSPCLGDDAPETQRCRYSAVTRKPVCQIPKIKTIQDCINRYRNGRCIARVDILISRDHAGTPRPYPPVQTGQAPGIRHVSWLLRATVTAKTDTTSKRYQTRNKCRICYQCVVVAVSNLVNPATCALGIFHCVDFTRSPRSRWWSRFVTVGHR